MLAALVMALVYVIIICVIGYLFIWLVGQFAPQFAQPARLVIGAIVLIACLLILMRVLAPALGGLP